MSTNSFVIQNYDMMSTLNRTSTSDRISTTKRDAARSSQFTWRSNTIVRPCINNHVAETVLNLHSILINPQGRGRLPYFHSLRVFTGRNHQPQLKRYGRSKRLYDPRKTVTSSSKTITPPIRHSLPIKFTFIWHGSAKASFDARASGSMASNGPIPVDSPTAIYRTVEAMLLF